jgi:dipeptidyl aminopeptidase/acylaminoacyl peptidase
MGPRTAEGWLVLVASLFVGSSAVCQAGPGTRSVQVEDVFGIARLRGLALSPDGRWLAIVRQRPLSDAAPYDHSFLSFARSDIWLVPTGAGVTHPLPDDSGSGAGSPVWAPQGETLAFLSTAGGDNVRLYTWRSKQAKPERLAEAGVDLLAQFSTSDGTPIGPLAWLDSTHVAAVLLPSGAAPFAFDLETRAQHLAMIGWQRTLRGSEPSVSVLDTEEADSELTQVALIKVDVTRHQIDTIAVLPGGRDYRRIVLAPNHGVAALVAFPGRPRVPPGLAVALQRQGASRLGLVSLRSRALVRWVPGVSPSMKWTVPAVEWSPDQRRLAVRGTPVTDRGPDRLFVVEASDRSARQISPDSIAVGPFAWAGSERIVMRSDGLPRNDWWRYPVQDRGRRATKLTQGLGKGPEALVPLDEAGTFVGIAGGALWLFSPKAAAPTRLIDTTAGYLTRLLQGSDGSVAGEGPTRSVVVETERDGVLGLARVIVIPRGGVRVESLPMPRPGAELEIDRPAHHVAVFTSGTLDIGPAIWTTDGRTPVASQVLNLNPQLEGIARPERRLVSYLGCGGEVQQALMLLPVGYQPDRRYPLIAYVYGGSVYRDTLDASVNLTDPSQPNPQLLAARGYAVLLPSMPLSPMGAGVGGEPYRDMAPCVLPALDAAIALGIADASRLAVMGHSYGGYAAYALATSTHRFKAAIALAGMADLISIYGQFDSRVRYDARPHGELGFLWAETGQGRMGAPPFDDADHYIRNSPLFYAEQIATPLLIIQGGDDFVPIQQGEEMFTALYRLGKRARFARYWGEGHVFDSPANIRDMWNEIYRWLDRYLQPGA